MAKGNAKSKSTRIWNTERPNGKAWKRRACGQRHAPANCRTCN